MDMKKKLKIGILTFHDGINHGAYLQCYSLSRILEESGYNVEIVNYKNFQHWLNEYKVFLLTKKIKVLINNINKIRKFRKSQKKFKLKKLIFSHRGVQKSRFDTLIIGSDEVWNFKNPLFGYDPIYFGHNLNVDKIIAFATSFGNVTVKDNIPQCIINGLKKFNAISVRDKNSQQIIKKILGFKPNIVLDPTFLYNFNGEEVEPPYKNYILVYAVGLQMKYIEELKKIGKRQNKKMISIAYNNNWCDINVIALDPFEWIGYFKNADYVITNTFHGTIFSIIYKKQFISIPHKDKKNKIISFIELLPLKNVLINNDLSSTVDIKIEYDTIIKKLDLLRKKSLQYLMENINK